MIYSISNSFFLNSILNNQKTTVTSTMKCAKLREIEYSKDRGINVVIRLAVKASPKSLLSDTSANSLFSVSRSYSSKLLKNSTYTIREQHLNHLFTMRGETD